MKLNIKLIEKIVGLFVLVAVIGLLVIIVFLGLNQRWFKKNFYFKSRFLTAKNLAPGMGITLSGFEIGKVDKITLNPEDKSVNMDFYIYEEYYPSVVFKDSIIELVSSPIGLGSGLVFHPGKDTSFLAPEGSLIYSYNTSEGLELVTMGLVDRKPTDDSIGSLIAQINPILQQIPPVLFAAKNLILGVDEAFKGTRTTQLGMIIHEVNNTIRTLEKTLKDVDTILQGNDTGPIGSTLANLSGTSDNVNQILDSVDKTIAELNHTIVKETGNIDLLLADLQGVIANVNTVIDSVDGVIANVDDLTADPTGLVVRLLDPQGSIKTFLDDDNALYNTVFKNVETMFTTVNQIIKELENFSRFITGTAPQISAILEEGKATLNMGQDVLEGLTNNPLLKGGITEKRDQPTTYSGYRDEEF